jgi:hypothetical protein
MRQPRAMMEATGVTKVIGVNKVMEVMRSPAHPLTLSPAHTTAPHASRVKEAA